MAAKNKKGGRKGRPVSKRPDVNDLSNEEFAAQLQAVCGEPACMSQSVENDNNTPSIERADSPLDAAPLEDKFMCEEEEKDDDEETGPLTKKESPETVPSSLLYFTLDCFGRPIAARNIAGPSMVVTHMPISRYYHPSQTFPVLRHATPAELADPQLFPPMVPVADGLMFVAELPSRRLFHQRADAQGTLWADWHTLLAEARVGCDVRWFEWVMAFALPWERPGERLCDGVHAQRVVNASAYEFEEMDRAKWASELESRNNVDDEVDQEEEQSEEEDEAADNDDDDDEKCESGSDADTTSADSDSGSDSKWSDVDDSMDDTVFEAMLRDARPALAQLHLTGGGGGGGVVNERVLANLL
ncbi:hypothetical protein BKA80DRAFT_273888, partial [Phyllosticta citrichinensis]